MPEKQVDAQPPPLHEIHGTHSDIDRIGHSLEPSAEGKLHVRIYRRFRLFVGVKQ
jgi:hypothetical protein